ncbi:ABC transporter ATP-binding protein [Rhizobium miluonense]|uniref:Peptide/nickel transport system ATP-binding protein n=1 Tax=Rhizobium miluonense TaxID=411945 RepID=A0A1C3WDE7_9HYPH|nr:ABC transporter ATP-binding protein [Rhizobium miluonense]SCB38182.1 peptide/nickel transport system ATP-binding protein [Rhizobium miluonense]
MRVSIRSPKGETEIVRGIDLDVGRGEILGLVGESGCGKSITWLTIMRVLGKQVATSGSVTFGRHELLGAEERVMASLRGRHIAMIGQDATASLNPIKTIGFQLVETLRHHQGFDGTTARAQAKRLLDQVRVPAADRRLGQYPHELSGGTNQRVAIAIALAGTPDLLIADEPTTALDVTVQAQILDLLREIRKETGMSMVLISHDLGVVRETSDRIAVMYAGRIVEIAPAEGFWMNASHPYTRGLLDAAPDIDEPIGRLRAIPGSVPAPNAIPAGCAFQDRCSLKQGICMSSVPQLEPPLASHRSACHAVAAGEKRPASMSLENSA